MTWPPSEMFDKNREYLLGSLLRRRYCCHKRSPGALDRVYLSRVSAYARLGSEADMFNTTSTPTSSDWNGDQGTPAPEPLYAASGKSPS